jgi:hypothetical protein
MLPSEFFRVLLFVTLVGSVYVLTLREAVKLILHKTGRRILSISRREVWYRRIVLSLAALGVICFLYGYLIEPYWPSVTRVKITSDKLPSGSRPIRIAHISDLHCDPKPRLEEKLPDIIAAEKPDIIVFTGDSANSAGGIPVFKQCMSRLSAIAPTFAVKGNWDTALWRRADLFGDTGARELKDKAVRIEIEGTPLWIGGVPAGFRNYIEEAFSDAPANELKILLYHYPDEIAEAARIGIDLYCAGHTHGGQVALPFYGALITLSQFGKKYEAGLYREQGTWMYVNRGIGMEGNVAPRVRFCARPEVTILEVSSQ